MRKSFLIAFLLLSVVGCSSIQTRTRSPKKLVFASDWIVSTLQSPYMGYRLFSPMQPVLWRDSVIVGNTIDGLISRDQETGGKIWQRRFKGGVGVGIAIADGIIFVGTGEGHFLALSATTGETVWSYPIRSEGVGAPVVVDGKVYFISGDHILYAFNSKTGRKLWTYNRQIRRPASVFGAGRPLVKGNKVYAGFADGYFVALDKKNGGLKWELSLKSEGRFRDINTSPVAFGKNIYVASFDGALFSLDFSGNINWKGEGGAAGDLLISKSRIYYSTSDGRLIGLDRLSGKIIWQKLLKHGYGTTPVLYKNVLLVGETSGDLLAVDPEQGQLVGSFSPGHGVSSPVVIGHSDRIYFASLGANLFSIKMKWKESFREWPWEKSVQ